jgi:hypothetical protein
MDATPIPAWQAACLCGAWIVAWFCMHFMASACMQDKPNELQGLAGRHSRKTFIRSRHRAQLYNITAVAGALVLFKDCRRFPADLLGIGFCFWHQIFFSMAVGHWVVSLWEDWHARHFFADGIDAAALNFGHRQRRPVDASKILLKMYLTHHLCAVAVFTACIFTKRLIGLGLCGLLFELPVICMARRELSLVQEAMWRFDVKAVQYHWVTTYCLFAIGRGAPALLYLYSLVAWTDEIDGLPTFVSQIYYCSGAGFSINNIGVLSLLCMWHQKDMERAQLGPDALSLMGTWRDCGANTAFEQDPDPDPTNTGTGRSAIQNPEQSDLTES